MSTQPVCLDMQQQARKILRRIVPWLTEPKNAGAHRTNYKGVRGRIGIVGGARDYAGAPYFASMAAMRLGADLSYVICSRDAGQAIKNYSPDLIVMPLLDCQDESLSRDKFLQARARGLLKAANDITLPVIIDADGLLIVHEEPDLVRSNSNILLTPNRIELQRMLNTLYSPKTFNLRSTSIGEIRKLVVQYSTDMKVAVLAKGVTDVISDQTSIELLTDELSGSNRRCGGQGDITSGLAGVYIHWLNQTDKTTPNKMARAGHLAAMTTRKANELAYKEYQDGMLTSHMLDRIQQALQSLLCRDMNEGLKEFSYAGLLSMDEIDRYKRQMIMDEFGPQRQLSLKRASALIIGAGGLGCPAAAYLGAGGIGRLGIVDDDKVEASNLHRQILHNMERVGMHKTESIKQAVNSINPNVEIVTHTVKMDRHNAVDLVEKYDIIIDCTDNLLARYLINDACVFAKKPLVSGAALKMDGQLTVYNYDEETPCFRCLFPEPPPPSAVGSCSDNGVLGVLPGIIGVHQALEAIKIGAGIRPAYAGKMLLFDGQLGLFRQVTLDKRKTNCSSCAPSSTLKRDLIDYEELCGQNCAENPTGNNILEEDERVTVEQYADIVRSGKPHVLVDVRPKEQSDISRLADALQLPVIFMVQNKDETIRRIRAELEAKKAIEVYVVCRKGFASQRGARIIQDYLSSDLSHIVVKDIIGGMTTWAKRADPKNYSCL